MSINEQIKTQIPPDVLAYINGADSQQHLQFDFLIGHWDVNAVRYNPDGSVQQSYKGHWEAKYLNNKRMVIDDFKALSPTGAEISSFVTLRTYSEMTSQWQIVGLGAHLPSTINEWKGVQKDKDMLLRATGTDSDGASFINKIRFYNLAEHEFLWESNLSFDDGESWIKTASLIATRANYHEQY